MARPEKSGIDYYPRDVGLCRDRKFRRLRLKYGFLAVAVYESLLDMIYADKGYYLGFAPEERPDVIWEILADLQGEGQPTQAVAEEIIWALAAAGLFDREMLETRRVLTSRRIQEIYYRATIERKAVCVDPDLWLLSMEEMQALSGRSSILRFFESRAENPVNRPCGTQSKVKEKKENDADEPGEAGENIFIELPLNDGTLWAVTESMAQKWQALYRETDVRAQLRKMRGWLDANPKRRKTRDGVERYVAHWLGKAQDQAGQLRPRASRMEVIE